MNNENEQEWRGIAKNYAVLNPETEKLLVKFLKMKIAEMYWNIILKLLIFVVIIISTIISAVKLVPFLEKQMGVFGQMQSSINGLPNISLQNNKSGQKNSVDEVIEEMSEAEKEFIVDYLNKK